MGDFKLPASDTGHASLRAMLAGLGTAGMLLGALAAVAALTVGVVAFSGWPGSPEADKRPAVTLGGELGGAQARVALAASDAISTSSTSRPTLPSRDGDADGLEADRGAAAGSPRQAPGPGGAPGRRPGSVATPAGGVTSSPSRTPATQDHERRRPVADGLDLTGREVGGAVKDGGTALGDAARPVSAPAAESLTTVGDRVGDAVTAATKVITEALRGIPSRPPR